MPADISVVRHQLDLYHARFLPFGIGLFEDGAPDAAVDDEGFISRVNRMVFLRVIPPVRLASRDLETAISAGGRLNQHAELIVFGIWMILGAMPGSTKRPGKAPDLLRLFKAASAAFAALSSPNSSPVATRVSTKDIAKYWKICFGETTATADHSSALRSLRKIIPEYLAYLKAGELEFNGVKVTASPQLSRLMKALKKPLPTGAPKATTVSSLGVVLPAGLTTPAGSPAVPVATPTAFEIPLCYSSPDAEAEYRNAGVTAPPLPSLTYEILPVEASSADHTLRADRVGRMMFKPNFDVAKRIRVEALIDRIALTFSTNCSTTSRALWNAVGKHVDNAVYVADRTIPSENRGDWIRCLPELDLSNITGQHFAVLIQEPTPANLRAVLNAIDNSAGIDGEVRPCLIELAVDFYPRDHSDPVEALLTREQIVGLVQRHHWAAGSGFRAHGPSVPREVDARQVYSAAGKTYTRYLSPDAADKFHSDAQLQEPSVRRRLLSAKVGNDLYLNASIYRGEETGPRRTNLQHKIADRRKAAKGTGKTLDNEERRARGELTLTSLEVLEQAGLKTIEDLAQCRFRSMSRNMLSFRLSTCAYDAAAVMGAIKQMKTRGINGVEMNQRAKVNEQREQMQPKPRKKDHEGWALMDWPEMNGLVGAALDRLQKGWRRF